MVERIAKKLPGKIWNVEMSTSGRILAVETRNEKEKKVSFSIYDFKNEKWLWEMVEFDETWWLNLLAVSDDRVYLNYFTEENNPEAKKIVEVDIEKLEVLAEHTEYESLDENKNLKLPLHYNAESDNYQKVAEFVRQHNSHNIVNAVDYMQTSTVIVISYYLRAEENLVNYLLITDSEGKELVNEVLVDNLDRVGIHTFFYVGNLLITIKDKTELVIFKL